MKERYSHQIPGKTSISQLREIEDLSMETGISQSEIVRACLTGYLHQLREFPSLISLLQPGVLARKEANGK